MLFLKAPSTVLIHTKYKGDLAMSENEKKSRYSQAQNKASQKYHKAHLEQLAIRVKKGKKDYYKAAAESAGMSLNAFVIQSMDEKIERDNLAPPASSE